jgi:hypothetical protein
MSSREALRASSGRPSAEAATASDRRRRDGAPCGQIARADARSACGGARADLSTELLGAVQQAVEAASDGWPVEQVPRPLWSRPCRDPGRRRLDLRARAGEQPRRRGAGRLDRGCVARRSSAYSGMAVRRRPSADAAEAGVGRGVDVIQHAGEAERRTTCRDSRPPSGPMIKQSPSGRGTADGKLSGWRCRRSRPR